MTVARRVAALALLLSGFQIMTQSASAAVLDKGTVEVTPSFAFSHQGFSANGTDQGSVSNLTVTARVGYCTSRRIEIEGGLIADRQSSSIPGLGSASTTGIGLTGGLIVNFGASGNAVPFLRGALGFINHSGDLGTETTFLAPILQAGMRFLVGHSASLNAAVSYQHESAAEGFSGLDANTFGVEVGVSIFPKVGS